jgi:hypothetical protein
MSATPEQKRAAESPETSQIELAQLAQIPELQMRIAANPSASDDLLDWLIDYGNAEVRAVLDPANLGPVPEAEHREETHDEESPAEQPWELDETSRTTSPVVAAPPRQRHDWDEMWVEEQEERRRQRLSDEQRRAEDARTSAEQRAKQEQADLEARAAEIKRWEAAYALAHDGASVPPGYVPPVSYPSAFSATGTGAREARTNGMAIAALVLALVGASLLGLIFAYIARGQIRRTNEQGSGMALAALVIGWIGVVASAIVLIWYTVLFAQVGTALQR